MSEAATSSPETTVSFIVESLTPVYVMRWAKDVEECSICRNQVEGPCVYCQGDVNTSSDECRVSWGSCGHVFHEHCIQQWVHKSHTCPIDRSPWEENVEWNANR